ncbi:MAG: methyltransferase [Deltaproteobacteria bacterium]|nr:methyltransferase [Deltaproteobacteria bacterium]
MDIVELYDLLWDFARQRVVTVASRTGILSKLSEQAASAAELSASLNLDELATGKVVRALCALGLLQADGERYRLTPELLPHFVNSGEDLTAFIDHAHHLYDSWGASLEDWLRSGRHVRGQRTREQTKKFGRAMLASARLLAQQVVAALDGLSGVEKVLDVGGGIGGYACVFCRAKKELKVTILDVDQVAELGQQTLADTEFSDCISFQAGDYHQADFGSGFDLVLLANVLHIEKPQAAQNLIKQAAKALAPGGRLAIVDFVIDDEKRSNVMGALFAINMRSFGDAHTQPDIRGWMQAAAIDNIRCLDLPPAHWLITGAKKNL